MLEVGCKHGPGGKSDPGLSFAETRSHFAAWVIVSSPLTLSHDINNDTIMDEVWPIISNKEVLAVSQSYAGFSGGPFKKSSSLVKLDDVNHAAIEKGMTEADIMATGPTVSASFQYLYKPLEQDGAKVAVLLMNSGNNTIDLSLDFVDIPGVKCTKCKVRDIWSHKDVGTFSKTFVAKAVGAHDCVFLVITSESGSESVVV